VPFVALLLLPPFEDDVVDELSKDLDAKLRKTRFIEETLFFYVEEILLVFQEKV